MSGRHEQSATGSRVRLWLTGLGLAFVAVLVAALAGPAHASSTTVQAQLSLTGLASADNPVGGSQLGVHPGDQVTFSAAGAPTAGLQQLGLSDLVDSVDNALSLGATFQITADFSGLPGGNANTVLSGDTTQTFAFPHKGTYSFTWTAQQVTALGVVPIDLDGNELAQAGVKLNAGNEYVGAIVSARTPPPGGIAVQLPGVSVAPSAPVVGQLPTISIPGVNLPTVSVSVPDLNPGSALAGGGSSASAGGSAAPGAGGGAASPTGPSYAPPGISVPQMVLGGLGTGGGSSGGSGGNGGFRLGVTGGGSSGQLAGAAGALSVSGASGSVDSGSGSTTGGIDGTGGSTKTVDLASSSSSPSGQLPVLLAILAVITLAVVAGLYARLYLLGRKAPSSS